MSRCIVFALAAICAAAGPAEAGRLISENSSWKYFKGRTEASSPANAWRALIFDDSGWATGPAPFYYGESLSGTLLSDMQGQYSCVFIRRTFDVADPTSISELRLNVLVDDGFIAWINGTEVFRLNMNPGEPTRTTFASAGATEPLQFVSRTITNVAAFLNAGQNVLAIQGFNVNLTDSTDFVIEASLTSHTVESTRPTIVSITPAPGTVSALSQITVTFDEAVTGVRAADLVINGNSATGVSGQDTVYSFTFAQPPYGSVDITWMSEHGIVDYAVQANRFDHTAPGATWHYDLVDQVPPVISNLFPPAGETIRSLSQVEVTFSEDVIGVDPGDLRMNGQAATNVIKTGAGPFTFQFPEPEPGPVQLTWVGNPGITDLAVPPNAFVPVNWSYQLDPNAATGDLAITEILAANVTGLADEDGQAEDWIEIHNRGTNAVNLAGWSLSDDADDPGRWVFPFRTLPPGAYLVVFASGKDRKIPASTNRFHTNFRLANGGEFLGLYTADSPRALVTGFAPSFPEQRNDHSFGYDSDGALRYFSTPTPGAPNGVSTILSVTEPVQFSVERGFYVNAFDLHLSSPTLASSIRYTLDGVEPTATVGTPYTGPLRITNSAMVRAVALRHNFLPSEVRTHSYLFNQAPAVRSLPAISIVTARSNLFGQYGIFGISNVVLVTNANPWYIPRSSNGVPIGYHNPSLHGIAWERPTSAELIKPEDNSGFQIDCGIRVQGSDWQRPRIPDENWKFSMRLYFRGDYGEGRLEYPWFPTHVENHDQIVVRAGYNDPDNPFIRDEMGRRLANAMGQVASVGSFAVVFLNLATRAPRTIYYNPCQRVHEEMLQQYHGGSGQWDVVGPSFATGAEELGVIDGDRTDFVSLVNYIAGQSDANIRLPGVYSEAARRLDMANFVDYLLLNAYSYMGDWPANNWRAGRDRAPGGIWRFYVWDAEWGLGFNGRSINGNSFIETDQLGPGNIGGSEIARIFQRLRQSPEHRLLWADRIHKHMFNGGALTDSNIMRQFNIVRDEMRGVLPGMDLQIANAWIPQRRPIFLNQCLGQGFLASSNAPGFNQHGGRVPLGFLLTMTNLAGPMYYTTNGSDPRVAFAGTVASSAAQYTAAVSLDQTMVVKARSLEGTNWSALTEAEFNVDSLLPALRITEIMYNPIGGQTYEFIELENYGGTPIDLSGMTFGGITFSFPDPTIVAAGARLVVVADPAAFATRYDINGMRVLGPFTGQLDNGGERITLRDPAGNTILSVSYDDEDGGTLWSAAADGPGYSLVLVDPAGDPDDPLSWSASPGQGGSPGAGDTYPNPPATVVISEVSAASSAQWIELYNPTAGAIDLAGYSLTDDAQAGKFVLPSLMIGTGQYLIVDPTNFFTLNARGDEVLLHDPQGNLISQVSFGLQAAGYTISRVNGGWTLGNPTPNNANIAASLGSTAGLVINEWLANALTAEDDWIELWNNSAQPVALQGVYLQASNAIFRISSRSYMRPYGFAQLFADEDPGPDHLDFRLPGSGATLIVYSDAGEELNRVTYALQAENVSQGRLPDGAGSIQTFPASPSPGASNYVISYSGPYVNEVMARNSSAFTNALGRVVDWIELYNPTPGAVDLGGMSLSVDGPEPFQWVFPPNSMIPSLGHLVVWCDGDMPASTSFSGVLNCGNSLNGDSGGVYLFSAAGQLVNFIEYGFQLENQSIGRVGTQWRLLQTHSAGTANGAAATLGSVSTLVFNEWMADPIRGDDWFELYNPAIQPVELGTLTVTDDPSLAGQGKSRIVPLSFIAPKGWVRFEADGEPSLGFDHVSFSLDAGGESLRLYSTVNLTNYTQITSVYFGPQSLGVSEGRLPDGAATIERFPGSATPGESNYQLPDNVLINEVLASTDQIEMYNPSSAPANIGGWFLSNSRLDYKLYRIPDGTSVPGESYLVITPTGFHLDTVAGGEVILAAADAAGNLSHQRVHAKYGPQAAGVSFGRFAISQGVPFVALTAPTLGGANAGALVGPVVINEIMYNPPAGGIEFIELHNVSSGAQSLAGWTLGNAVRVSLPSVSLPAGAFLVVEILPEHGRLDNDGERIDLLKPGGILVDSIDYGDSTPWPSGPVDGEGFSLQRRNSAQFGDEPLNWLASNPTPDTANASGAATLPVISAQPQSQSIAVDTTFTLAVDASGAAPLGYQWRFNGVDIPGANARELIFNFAQVEHIGRYDVLVNNGAGTTLSAAADVFVQQAPFVLVPPQSQTVASNGTVTLSIDVRASPPISYQWYFNAVLIPGATTRSYTVNNALLDDNGEYSVLVSNPFGSVTASADLVVQIKPMFTLQPLAQTVVQGDDATFRVAVTGLPPFFYRWRRNSVNFTNGIGFNTSIMTFTNVPLSFSNSTVECIVSNMVPNSALRSDIVRMFVLPDTDHDLLPDAWEIANDLSVTEPDASGDPDQDNVSNREEYLAGTDPNDKDSFLRVTLVDAVFGPAPAALLSFKAASNKTYSVQYRDRLTSPGWSKLLDVEGASSNRLMEITDTNADAVSRFYQLVTPATR